MKSLLVEPWHRRSSHHGPILLALVIAAMAYPSADLLGLGVGCGQRSATVPTSLAVSSQKLLRIQALHNTGLWRHKQKWACLRSIPCFKTSISIFHGHQMGYPPIWTPRNKEVSTMQLEGKAVCTAQGIPLGKILRDVQKVSILCHWIVSVTFSTAVNLWESVSSKCALNAVSMYPRTKNAPSFTGSSGGSSRLSRGRAAPTCSENVGFQPLRPWNELMREFFNLGAASPQCPLKPSVA